MAKRFVSVWFRHLDTDWFSLRQPHLRKVPFVLKASSHGKVIVTAANAIAWQAGVRIGMALADVRAFVPGLEALDNNPDLVRKALKRLAEWCIRFTPSVAVDPDDASGLLMDATGCPHLWGGDIPYVKAIGNKLRARGYDVRVAMADTIGAAWAMARFGAEPLVVEGGKHREALMALPPESLRLETESVERLRKLGLYQVRQFIGMPRGALRRRFGQAFLNQLDKALGNAFETLAPVIPVEPYQERLPCLEPIVAIAGIEIALRQLLEKLCLRLQQEQKGLRLAVFKCFRVDGKVEQVEISTNSPSHHIEHLFNLFGLKLATITPALGIELFVLEAGKVDDHFSHQEKMWQETGGLTDERLSELIDRLASRIGMRSVNRYLADEHYWPERSFRSASSLREQSVGCWRPDTLRPLLVLPIPEPVEVTAPIPDYPPMLFRYKDKIHKIVKADGPERIEQEWWLQRGQHRDYYRVEDEDGHRYWIFRLGHYDDKIFRWFIHGFFA